MEKKKYYKTIQVDKKQVRLHRFLMEQKVGRKLNYNEVVHHLDGNIYNNSLSNLSIVSRSEHILMHPEINISAINSKTKYFIDKGLLNELYAVKRITLKEISKIVGLSDSLLIHYIKKFGIVRKEIYCQCGAKLKFSKTMMCTTCRTKYNRRMDRCQK